MKPSAGGGAKRATRSEASETNDATLRVRFQAQEVEPSAGGGGNRATRSEASETNDATIGSGFRGQEVEPDARDPAQRERVESVLTRYSLIAMRTVESTTVRSLPGVPGQATVTAIFHKRTAMAVAAMSRSGVEPGGVYGEMTVVHA